MKVWLIALALIVPASGAAAQRERVRTAPINETIDWPDAPANARYRVGTINLGMRNVVSGQDSEQLRRVLTIEAPGLPAFTVENEEGQEPAVMVVRNPSGAPTILFQTYSGGAHCCTTIEVIQPRGGRFESVVAYEGDGGPIEEAPTDMDGDGVLDIIRYDNSFLYTFASYAESSAPYTVTNVVDGQAVDVSTRPGFRVLFENLVERDGAACRKTDESNRNGACASYVASAARIGRFDAAWADMLQHWDRQADWGYPQGCRVARSETCPEGQEITFTDFPSALRAFLVDAGYIAQ